jgi:lantibiotic leader peptide-processing serine protease
MTCTTRAGWGVERIHAPAAWALGGAFTGTGARVGIIDTGIASNHPDLGANVAFNSCFSSQGDVIGRNWEAGDPCNPYPSLSDHGTHVAGTVAARFGGGRVIGVAPNAQLYNYNVFEFIPGVGVRSYSSSRWRAMIHAADNGVDVINMSLGSFTFIGNDPKKFEAFGLEHTPGRNDALATFMAAESRVANYVARRGTVMASSAGNSAADLNGAWVALPGQIQGHITVGGTGIRPLPRYQPGISTDVLAFFSNYGAAIDLVAPGGDCGPVGCDAPALERREYLVFSTIVAPGAACAQTRTCPAGYGWKGGTSMAAPHVAGVVAIARAVNPGLSAHQVNSLLTRTAQSLGDRQQFGHGMVDALAAARGR